MNILFLLGVYPSYGGTEKITTILSNSLAERGYNIHIASFSQPHPELASELRSSITLHALRYPVYTKDNVSKLSAIIRDGSIDIIVNQWCLPYFTTMLCNKARRGTRCKLISALHGMPDKSKKVIMAEDAVAKAGNIIKRSLCKAKLHAVNTFIKLSIRYVYNHSDSYMVLSQGFIQSFRRYTGLTDTPKLLSISNPITIAVDYSTDYTLPGKKRRQILYVGRMDMENKRVNRIIEVWEQLYKSYTDWELVLVGDGPHKKQLEDYVLVKGIKRVTFTGFVKEEPVEYYKRASILMLTSDLEGFGLVIVEGMSYGVVPVVYGSYVSVYDIITDGEDGCITSMPFSAEETAKCLRHLMDNDDERRRMARNAVKASKKFAPETILAQYEQLFKSV